MMSMLKALLFGVDKSDRKIAIGFWIGLAVLILWLVAIIRGWI